MDALEPQKKPIDQVAVEFAGRIKARLAAKAKGQEYVAPAEPKGVNWAKGYTATVIAAGVLAVCIGVAGLVAHHDGRLNSATIAVGVSAIAFQYALMIAAALRLILLIGLVFSGPRLGLTFKPTPVACRPRPLNTVGYANEDRPLQAAWFRNGDLRLLKLTTEIGRAMRKLLQAACVSSAMIALSLPVVAEVKIEQEQALMPAKQWAAAERKETHAARLSPDGKYMLYAPRNASGESPLVVRELSNGRDTPLPLGRQERGMADVFTRFNFFSPDGRRLILIRPKNVQPPPPSVRNLS